MIKLKDLLQLNSIKYSDKIKPKHQKKMSMQTELIKSEMRIPEKPFPENSSQETRDELQWLLDYNDGVINRKFIKEGDDIEVVFKEYCDNNNLKYNKKRIGFRKVLRQFKCKISGWRYRSSHRS